MDSAGKEAKSQPMHGPPLQARVAAANRTVLQLANMLYKLDDDPGAHGMNRGKQNEQNGATVEEGSGYGMAKASRHTACRTRHCRQTQPADSPPGTGLKKQTASRWPASQRNNSCRRRWPASRRAVQVDGGSAVVLALRRPAQTYLPCLYPTYHLCLCL